MGGILVLAGLVLLIALIVPISSAMAGGSPPPKSVARDQRIARAVVQYPKPPRDSDPLSASEAELANYGVPPRPDVQKAPMAFHYWKKLVSVPRVTNGSVGQTKIYNGPIQQPSVVGTLKNGSVSLTSANWSGYAVDAASGTFTFNNSAVFSEWVVPVAQQPFGVCDGSWDYSSQWIGFDGLSSGDVLQAGTEADAYCSGSTLDSFYSAWIEWFPFSEIRVAQPIVQAGNLMQAEVWYTTTPPFGHAYLANLTLGQAAAYAFDPPPGIAFQGDSAEWVLERPGLETGLANLTNYVPTNTTPLTRTIRAPTSYLARVPRTQQPTQYLWYVHRGRLVHLVLLQPQYRLLSYMAPGPCGSMVRGQPFEAW